MERLRPEFRSTAIARLERSGLGDARDLVLGRCSETVRVSSGGPDDYSAVGNSRFGGDPDLPPGWAWPAHRRGDGSVGYSNFICQVNFEELPKVDVETPLPKAGVFYVFVHYMESAAEPAFVDGLFHPGPVEELERRATPPNEQLLDDEYLFELKPNRVEFAPGFDCNASGRAFRRQIDDVCGPAEKGKSPPHDRFQEFCYACPSGGSIGQILGFANAVNDDLYRQVALSQLGARRRQYSDYWDSIEEFEAAKVRWPNMADRYEAKRPDVEWLLEHAEEIRAEADRWQHLLRIDSNRHMDIWINDADPMYVFARAADIAEERFDALACEVTQG